MAIFKRHEIDRKTSLSLALSVSGSVCLSVCLSVSLSLSLSLSLCARDMRLLVVLFVCLFLNLFCVNISLNDVFLDLQFILWVRVENEKMLAVTIRNRAGKIPRLASVR